MQTFMSSQKGAQHPHKDMKIDAILHGKGAGACRRP
jgi:hypothetical protein